MNRMCFCCLCCQVKIWMRGILSVTSFTLVALIMHTDKLLLDSDLLFQKVGGNVQHTLLKEWSSCTYMKWVGMILSLFLFFDVLFWMCNVYISTSEGPTWLKACLRLGTKQKVFLFAKLWTVLPEARWSTSKAKGILCQHLKLTATDPPKE